MRAELRARLPLPTGDDSWQADALAGLKAAGWRRLPHGKYWIAVLCGRFTCGPAPDVPLQTLILTIADALGIDFRDVAALAQTNVLIHFGEAERLEVRALIVPLSSRKEWAALSAGFSRDVSELVGSQS